MAKIAKVTGMETIAKNINKELTGITKRSQVGLNKAAEFVLEIAEHNTPVVLRNLQKSGFIVDAKGSIIKGSSPDFVGPRAGEYSKGHSEALGLAKGLATASKNPVSVLGFGVPYAIVVHENPNAGRATYPGASKVGKYKFLEDPLKGLQKEIVDIVAQEAKVD